MLNSVVLFILFLLCCLLDVLLFVVCLLLDFVGIFGLLAVDLLYRLGFGIRFI